MNVDRLTLYWKISANHNFIWNSSNRDTSADFSKVLSVRGKRKMRIFPVENQFWEQSGFERVLPFSLTLSTCHANASENSRQNVTSIPVFRRIFGESVAYTRIVWFRHENIAKIFVSREFAANCEIGMKMEKWNNCGIISIFMKINNKWLVSRIVMNSNHKN